jgi:hypothetical protein
MEGRAEQNSSQHDSQETETEFLQFLAFSFFICLFHLAYGWELSTFWMGLSPLSKSFLEMSSQTHSEVCLTIVKGTKQSNQVDNQD